MAKGKYEYWLTAEGLLKLEGWARDGLVDEQIAKNIGINRDTLYSWKKKYADISNALRKGKEVVDIQVENALLKRALGYSYKEITKERIIDKRQKQRHKEGQLLTEKEWGFAVQYFEGRCCYCGEKVDTLTKDHVIPLNKGGEMKRDNIVPCCSRCNSSKKDIDMEIWYRQQPFYKKDRLNKIMKYISIMEIHGSLLFDQKAAELVVTKEVTKEVAADVAAQIFWLKNRKPNAWRDKQKEAEDTTAIDRLDSILAEVKKAAEKDQGVL